MSSCKVPFRRFGLLTPLMLGLLLVACEFDDDPAEEENGENGDHPAEECPAPSELGGRVRESVTLGGRVDCVDYRLTSNLTITDDAVLTIEPGVTIVVENDLLVTAERAGALSAVGAEDEPIVFTAAEPEIGWRGVQFHNSNKTENRLEHVVVEYAGSRAVNHSNGAASVYLTTSGPTPPRVSIVDTTIRFGLANGLDVAWNSVLPEFTDNFITENVGVPVFVHATAAEYLDGGTGYAGNGEDVVHVVGSRALDTETLWAALEVPWRVDGDLRAEARFTIEAGATLSFTEDSALTVRTDGVLVAEGTADAPIVLTADDESLGWKGVYLLNSTSVDNILDHVVLEYAGNSSMTHAREPASLVLTTNNQSPVRLRVTNSAIRNGFGNGFEFSSYAVVPEFLNNTVTGNAERPGYVYSRTAHWLDDSTTYVGNEEDAVFVRGEANVEDDILWKAIDADYLIEGSVRIYGHLVIEPGARLVFRNDASLVVYSEDGVLEAVGTEDAPIVFTSAVEVPGYWRGIGFLNAVSPLNELKHVIVEYAGGGGLPHQHASANIAVAYSNTSTPSRVTVSEAVISHSNGCGVSINPLAAATTNLDLGTIVFSDNAGADVCQQ